MASNKLEINEIHAATFAGNSTITVVRPAGTVKAVKDGVEVQVARPESRYTFKVTRAKGEEPSRPWFVKVLFGPNNEDDYVFLGTVFPGEEGLTFRSSAKSPVKATDARFLAFNWVVEKLAAIARLEKAIFTEKLAGNLFPPIWVDLELAAARAKFDAVEVWFEATCCRCGRKLTVPSSIARFLGPECAKKVKVLA